MEFEYDKPYSYSKYNEFNRFQNIDSVEGLIVNHLVKSHTKHAELFWKLLKYNDINALSQPNVSEDERLALVCNDNGEQTSKRVFFAPFVDDAWTEQCSSVYIFVENIYPIDHTRAAIGVTIESITHSKISAIAGDGDPILNPNANPNDSDIEGNIVVSFKNRATVLLKCILAEINGLYLNGVGYLQLNNQDMFHGKVEMPLWNSRSFYGHSTSFFMVMGNVSETPDVEESY